MSKTKQAELRGYRRALRRLKQLAKYAPTTEQAQKILQAVEILKLIK